MKKTTCALTVLMTAALGAAVPPRAEAFPHVVRQGETLAQIATRVYGNPKMEAVLAGANFLDVQGGSAPVPGMRLEIPAPSYHKVTARESWGDLALRYLGDAKRSDVLARLNRGVAWIPPVDGLQIQIPFVLTVICGEGERMTELAHRYLGDANRAWSSRPTTGASPPRAAPCR